LQNNTFSTLFVGQNLIKLSAVDSTNNFLKELLTNSEPLPEGTVIMADHQFAGRGQRDNKWITEPGLNFTASFLLKPSFLEPIKQFSLNMAVSLAIKDCLNLYIKEGISIKWPNDIYYLHQKIGGVLIENVIFGQQLKASIIGIGINVNQLEFDPTISDRVISMKKILHQNVNLNQLLAELCSQIEKYYLLLKADKQDFLLKNYLKHLYKYNTSSKYRQNGEVFEGKIIGVTSLGLLQIMRNDGVVDYNFKEIEFINN
jgi:BirA family biotin operon repressor/biotin-[acetyl-CoA-carboxylase] ligase